MPAPTYIGTFPVTLREVYETRIDGARVYSITRVYKNDGTAVYGTIGSSLVVDGVIYYESSNSSDAKDGLVEVTRVFVYAPASAISYDYECTAVASEEPIETHPAFLVSASGFATSIVTAAGGYLTDGAASGGAVFDEDGIFLGFNKDALNSLSGVRSYLSPQVSFKVKYATNNRPSSGVQTSIGTIASPLNPPAVGGGKNWLLTEVNWSNAGNGSDGIYEVSQGYRLSGEGGWNTNIYS
jgi:hypothetical protein